MKPIKICCECGTINYRVQSEVVKYYCINCGKEINKFFLSVDNVLELVERKFNGQNAR